MDCAFAPSPASAPPPPAPPRRRFLSAARGLFAAEFTAAHRLTPVRVAFHGPDAAGRSLVAAQFAEAYGLPLVTRADLERTLAKAAAAAAEDNGGAAAAAEAGGEWVEHPEPLAHPALTPIPDPYLERRQAIRGLARLLNSTDCRLRCGFALVVSPFHLFFSVLLNDCAPFSSSSSDRAVLR